MFTLTVDLLQALKRKVHMVYGLLEEDGQEPNCPICLESIAPGEQVQSRLRVVKMERLWSRAAPPPSSTSATLTASKTGSPGIGIGIGSLLVQFHCRHTIASHCHLFNILLRNGTCPVCREMLAEDEEGEEGVGGDDEEAGDEEVLGGAVGGEGGGEEAEAG